MADSVFIARVVAASVVAMVLLLGSNGMSSVPGPLAQPAHHSLAGK
jgi:hypothetical protein